MFGGKPRSPDQPHVGDEFQVQPDVAHLALAGVEAGVEGAALASSGYTHLIPHHIQYTWRQAESQRDRDHHW